MRVAGEVFGGGGAARGGTRHGGGAARTELCRKGRGTEASPRCLKQEERLKKGAEEGGLRSVQGRQASKGVKGPLDEAIRKALVLGRGPDSCGWRQ